MNKEQVNEILNEVVDPCTQISVTKLGLIHEVTVDDEAKKIIVDLNLTTPFCPYTGTLDDEIEMLVHRTHPDYSVEVSFEKGQSWHPDMMDAEARKQVGM